VEVIVREGQAPQGIALVILEVLVRPLIPMTTILEVQVIPKVKKKLLKPPKKQ
jgi:hypothetical protein